MGRWHWKLRSGKGGSQVWGKRNDRNEPGLLEEHQKILICYKVPREKHSWQAGRYTGPCRPRKVDLYFCPSLNCFCTMDLLISLLKLVDFFFFFYKIFLNDTKSPQQIRNMKRHRCRCGGRGTMWVVYPGSEKYRITDVVSSCQHTVLRKRRPTWGLPWWPRG